MIALDTDIVAIYFIFIWDKRYDAVRSLIESDIKKALTIYNVLELCGLMSIAQGGSKAIELFKKVHMRDDFKILYWREYPQSQSSFISKILRYIRRGLSLGDAITAWLIEEHDIDIFITYNKKHFINKILANVMTPEEYLESVSYTHLTLPTTERV